MICQHRRGSPRWHGRRACASVSSSATTWSGGMHSSSAVRTRRFSIRAGWKQLIESVFRHRTYYFVAEREAEIVGVLPLAEVKSLLFGHALVSLPFGVYGGVAATDSAAVPALHAAARELAGRLGVDHLELRNRVQREPDWPRQDLYVTFRKEIAGRRRGEHAGDPAQAARDGAQGDQARPASEIDETVERFFGLYADNVHRHGTPPFPKRYFEALKRVFGRDARCSPCWTRSGVPVSGVLTFYFRDEVLPYYAGDSVAARELAANDFKYWELMRRACERGFRVFDFGRSKRGTGSFDFKKNWGFEPAPLSYEYVLLRGDKIPENNPAESEVPCIHRAVAAPAGSDREPARTAYRAKPRLVHPRELRDESGGGILRRRNGAAARAARSRPESAGSARSWRSAACDPGGLPRDCRVHCRDLGSLRHVRPWLGRPADRRLARMAQPRRALKGRDRALLRWHWQPSAPAASAGCSLSWRVSPASPSSHWC